jgi:hypothetical protein
MKVEAEFTKGSISTLDEKTDGKEKYLKQKAQGKKSWMKVNLSFSLFFYPLSYSGQTTVKIKQIGKWPLNLGPRDAIVSGVKQELNSSVTSWDKARRGGKIH